MSVCARDTRGIYGRRAEFLRLTEGERELWCTREEERCVRSGGGGGSGVVVVVVAVRISAATFPAHRVFNLPPAKRGGPRHPCTRCLVNKRSRNVADACASIK